MAQIHTERLLLRPFRRDDADAIVSNLNDERITSTTAAIPSPYTQTDADAWLDRCARLEGSREQDVFAIEDGQGLLVGAIDLRYDIPNSRAEVGYWIAVDHWNKGFATEALRAVIGHGFEREDCSRIYAHHYVGNESSGRVMQKAGMRFEGVLREHVVKLGVAKDCVCYGVLKREWGLGLG